MNVLEPGSEHFSIATSNATTYTIAKSSTSTYDATTLSYCDSSDPSQGIECNLKWSVAFYVIVFGSLLCFVVTIVLMLRYYRMYRRDWKVYKQDEQGSFSDPLSQALLMDTSEEDSGVSFDYFGYGMIDFNRELWLHEEIGSGMFGVVRRATLRRRRKMKARYVAVKELFLEGSSELIEEAKAMFDIPNHENVVSLLGVCDSPPCLITAMVDGAQMLDVYLKQIQAEGCTIHYLEVVHTALTDIASGVTHLHRHELMHRDLAPRNVLVNTEGRCLVNDFGLSRTCGVHVDKQDRCIHCGENPREERMRDRLDSSTSIDSNTNADPHEHELNINNQYFRAAPENFDYFGRQIHSRDSDVFMFGAIMWQAVTGLWPSTVQGMMLTGFWKYFDEGKGVRGSDISQVTRAASCGRPPMFGLKEFAENLKAAANCVCPCCVSGYTDDAPLAASIEYRSEMLKVLIQTLQHKPDDRLEMASVHRKLMWLRKKYGGERHTPLTPNGSQRIEPRVTLSPQLVPREMGTSWLHDLSTSLSEGPL